ncbi:MAG TPA: SPOR domain-containing protein [Chitinophagales bacterium]|nr:SPOR domain-containing protein [Chitinophagales bacterium]
MKTIMLYSKAVMLVLFCLGAIEMLSAQDTTVVFAAKNYTIKQDDGIASLLYKYKEYNHKREFADGYRVQIMYTDVRDEVYKSKATLYKEFSDLTSYVEYEQPYYKLRVGDFKTRLDATYYLQQIITLYPGAFIVRDKIKIK